HRAALPRSPRRSRFSGRQPRHRHARPQARLRRAAPRSGGRRRPAARRRGDPSLPGGGALDRSTRRVRSPRRSQRVAADALAGGGTARGCREGLMELWVKLGKREERVRIRRDGDLFEVAIGEVVHRVEAAVLGRGTYSLRLEGIQSEVAVRASGEDRLRVTAATSAWEVEVADPLAHLAAIAGGGRARKRHRKVAAYMPGRVVAVLVEAGAEVAAGQGIV